MPLVSVIIVNYKEYDMTAQCLKSIQDTTYPNYEVIVIDNESNPDKLSKLKEMFRQVRFIPSEENLYYACGNNLGIEKSSGSYIVLLNNDTKITSSWLDSLVQAAAKNSLAFYQPRIMFMDNPECVNSVGNTINIFGFAFPLGIGKKDHGEKGIHEVFYCSGACVFLSRDVIRKIGFLDSNFYTYYEDVNWGWRGHLVGIKSYVVAESVIYHKWGGSYQNKLNKNKLYLLEKGRVASIIRNFSLKTLCIILPSLMIIDLALLLYGIKNGMFQPKIRAMVDVAANLNRILRERKQIQSKRSVKDKELFHLVSREINHSYFDSAPRAKLFLDKLATVCLKLLQ